VVAGTVRTCDWNLRNLAAAAPSAAASTLVALRRSVTVSSLPRLSWISRDDERAKRDGDCDCGGDGGALPPPNDMVALLRCVCPWEVLADAAVRDVSVWVGAPLGWKCALSVQEEHTGCGPFCPRRSSILMLLTKI